MKKRILILISVLTLSIQTKAQSNFENILLADVNDSQKLLQAYFAKHLDWV